MHEIIDSEQLLFNQIEDRITNTIDGFFVNTLINGKEEIYKYILKENKTVRETVCKELEAIYNIQIPCIDNAIFSNKTKFINIIIDIIKLKNYFIEKNIQKNNVYIHRIPTCSQ